MHVSAVQHHAMTTLTKSGLEFQVLLDVGAGIGYYSLAASARGHQSIATELSAGSTASFKASIWHNGFDEAITLHEACPHSKTFTSEDLR